MPWHSRVRKLIRPVKEKNTTTGGAYK